MSPNPLNAYVIWQDLAQPASGLLEERRAELCDGQRYRATDRSQAISWYMAAVAGSQIGEQRTAVCAHDITPLLGKVLTIPCAAP
jgi:hypothetical protein